MHLCVGRPLRAKTRQSITIPNSQQFISAATQWYSPGRLHARRGAATATAQHVWRGHRAAGAQEPEPEPEPEPGCGGARGSSSLALLCASSYDTMQCCCCIFFCRSDTLCVRCVRAKYM